MLEAKCAVAEQPIRTLRPLHRLPPPCFTHRYRSRLQGRALSRAAEGPGPMTPQQPVFI